MTSQSFRTMEEKDNYWSELKTAAETGWDFSTRWFILDGTNKGTSMLFVHYIFLSFTHTPVKDDLQSAVSRAKA